MRDYRQENRDKFIEALRLVEGRLEDYLAMRGVEVRTSGFNCVSPYHEDNGRHMTLKTYSGKQRVCCKCNPRGWDTFDTYLLIDHNIEDSTTVTPKQRAEYMAQFLEVLNIPFDYFNFDGKKVEVTAEQKAHNEKMLQEAKERQRIHREKEQREAAQIAEQVKKYTAFAQNTLLDDTKNARAVKYLWEKRRISIENAMERNLGYMPTPNMGFNNWECILAPTDDGKGCVLRNMNIEPDTKGNKTINRGRGSTWLFNYEKAKEADHFYIFEGWADAMSAIEVGHEAVALCGLHYKHIIDAIKRDISDFDGKTVCINLDNDKAGNTANLEAYRELLEVSTQAKLQGITLNVYPTAIQGNYKDANAALVAEPEEFAHRASYPDILVLEESPMEEERQKTPEEIEQELEVERVRAEHLNANMGYNLTSFRERIEKRAQAGSKIDTGYIHLNDILQGGLYEGLYVLIGNTGSGKTAFCMQMAEQIAYSEKPVLYVALEMAEYELSARAQSRRTFVYTQSNGYDKSIASTARDILNYADWETYPEQKENLIKLVEKSMPEDVSNLYIYDGMGSIGVEDIRKRAETYRDILGVPPVIFVDYLQILKPTLERGTDKMNNDYNIVRLKHLSRDLQTPVIAISSTARGNYGKPIHIASAKETGAIEYTSDVVIGLEFEGIDRKADGKMADFDDKKSLEWQQEKLNEKPRQMQAKILKNRYGSPYSKAYYAFYPEYSHIETTASYIAD